MERGCQYYNNGQCEVIGAKCIPDDFCIAILDDPYFDGEPDWRENNEYDE